MKVIPILVILLVEWYVRLFKNCKKRYSKIRNFRIIYPLSSLLWFNCEFRIETGRKIDELIFWAVGSHTVIFKAFLSVMWKAFQDGLFVIGQTFFLLQSKPKVINVASLLHVYFLDWPHIDACTDLGRNTYDNNATKKNIHIYA